MGERIYGNLVRKQRNARKLAEYSYYSDLITYLDKPTIEASYNDIKNISII